ncbi:porin [Aquabacterium sp.]|uniref:porin n=1 Tax=Aquabacterium sp. TaxID=1872578 RepID=UPI0040378EB2
MPHHLPRHTAALMACALASVCASQQALAQSSVSVSGRIDLNVGRDIGNSATRMGSGAMSHLAFSGSEDLSDGRKAFFMLDSRINADDGSVNNPGAFLNNPRGTFWSQASYVGLSGGWGSLSLGRHMTAALLPQILVDPWQWDNVTTGFNATTGMIGNLWYNNAVTYDYGSGPYSLSAQVAEKDGNPGWTGTTNRNPYSFALGYTPGPWQFRLGYERPADGTSRLLSLFTSYAFTDITVNGMLGRGRDGVDASVKTWAVSGVMNFGTDQVRAAYGEYKRLDDTASQKLSLGYYHYLSKRTAVYANFAHDRKVVDYRSGYELGLQHVF